MKKFVILEAASLSELNEKMNSLSDKYAPVGNLIFVGDQFIQQVQLSERGEELLELEEKSNYVRVSSLEELLEVLYSGKKILLESDIADFPSMSLEKPVEIDLKGHTLSLAADAGLTLLSDLKLSNGAVLSEIAKSSYTLRVEKGYLELNNMVINQESTKTYGGITTRASSKEDINVLIKNSTIFGKNAAFVSFGGVIKLYKSNLFGGDYAVSSNGLATTTDSDMHIEDCVLSATGRGNDSAGIYWPNKGNLIIKNSSVSGEAAAYLKCGDVRLIGGVFKSVFESKVPYKYYGNGFYVTGDTIVCDACNYPKKDARISIVGISVERACPEAYDVAEYSLEGHIPSQELNISSQLSLKVLHL